METFDYIESISVVKLFSCFSFPFLPHLLYFLFHCIEQTLIFTSLGINYFCLCQIVLITVVYITFYFCNHTSLAQVYRPISFI